MSVYTKQYLCTANLGAYKKKHDFVQIDNSHPGTLPLYVALCCLKS